MKINETLKTEVIFRMRKECKSVPIVSCVVIHRSNPKHVPIYRDFTLPLNPGIVSKKHATFAIRLNAFSNDLDIFKSRN